MKKAILIIVALLTVLTTGSVYASKKPEIIYEKEIALISVDENLTRYRYKKVTKVLIDGQLYIKVYNISIFDNDKFVKHVVKYTDQTTGNLWRIVYWREKNGKVSFPSGEKPVKIVTEY